MYDNDVPRGLYQHFKGGTYRVLCVAIDQDSEKAVRRVIYIALGKPNEVHSRKIENFLEEVNRPEIPYRGPRFVRIKKPL